MMQQTAASIDLDLESLNDAFRPLHYMDRIKKLYEYFILEDVLVTSSFGTRSAFLLHAVSQVRPEQSIHFIDTTYHFRETLEYKESLSHLLGLNVVSVFPEEKQNTLTKEQEWWLEHPKMCCTINKIQPLEPVIANHRVWIAGLMAWQTTFRSRLDIFTRQGDIIKFHPFIDIDEGEFLYHLSYHELPPHPLVAEGYGSVGCSHCTRPGAGRSGRWQKTQQTECGLHPNFFLKKKS